MLSVLCSGSLVSDPRERTTQAGKSFATASMRVPAEDGEALLASLIAFDAGAVSALLALRKGDALAVSGRGKLTEWEKNGEQRHGLSVTVDRVLSAYQAGKARKAARDTEGAECE